MIDTFRKVRDLLDPDERRTAVLLFFAMLAMGLLEVAGVASIMPFMAVVANPEIVHTNYYLSFIYQTLEFTDTNDFLILLGVVAFVLVVGSLGFRAFTIWAMARYVHMRSYTLSSRLLRGYLNRPYSFFLNRHSADLGKSVLSEVGAVVNKALMPSMELIAHGIVATMIVALVIAVNPFVALTVFGLIGGAYSAVYIFLKGYLSRVGAERVRANRERFQIAQEAFGGIKDVKVLRIEDGYIKSFRKPARRMAGIMANQMVITEVPTFVMQAVVFGVILLLLLALLFARDGNLGEVLPLMAVYAMSASRLNRAVQMIYKSISTLRFGKPLLDVLHRDLVETGATSTSRADEDAPRNESNERISLKENISLDKIVYTYPQAHRPALQNLNLTIPARTTVGLVGSTGAGKTTVVDVILGLLEPQEGKLLVDGRHISGSTIEAWQRNLGYVPQHIFLTDDTIAANIAFGVATERIDREAVERAARVAELHDFVTQELPEGYQTVVGERGVRLSGGQRQRIGIARALYRDPDVLFLDEATSALDNLTEKAVMDAVHKLGHRKTIIIIAHRLSSVRECDIIYILEHGELKASGAFDELAERNENFRLMAAGLV